MTDHGFHTTHWTAILAVKGDDTKSRDALRSLCDAYYAPVLNFVARSLRGRRDSVDLTHDFFVRVLQGEEFRHLERGRGRFRSYLLGAVKFFLSADREKRLALKRGGNLQEIPPDVDPPELSEESDAGFDRDWAETIVSLAVSALRKDAENNGQGKTFDYIRHWLTGSGSDSDRDQALTELGISREYFKVLVSRTRKKFREYVRALIAQSVESESEIAAELDYLINVLSSEPLPKATQ